MSKIRIGILPCGGPAILAETAVQSQKMAIRQALSCTAYIQLGDSLPAASYVIIIASWLVKDSRGGQRESGQETPMKFKALGLAAIAVGMYAVPALAHHSFAMFDAEKKTTLEGTVKEFQWTNPHSWILMTVNNDQWAIEMGAPGGLARQGWVPKTLTPGMKITAVIHPLKDGTHGGQFMAVTLPDGTVKGNPNGAANANAGGN
jgi:hypothetical protein